MMAHRMGRIATTACCLGLAVPADAQTRTVGRELGLGVLTAAGDEMTIGVSRTRRIDIPSRSVSAVIGWGSAERSLEFGAFEDRGAAAAGGGAAQIVRSAMGQGVRMRGIRMTGVISGVAEARAGWSLGLDARHQQAPDVETALRGTRRSLDEARVSLSGRLKF